MVFKLLVDSDPGLGIGFLKGVVETSLKNL